MAKKQTSQARSENKTKWALLALGIFDRFLDVVTVVFFGLMILIGGYAIYDSYMVYDSATLADDILALAPNGENFALKDLQKINEDIVAWVQVDGTHIDYPVVAGKDNTEYLNLDYKGDYATAGSIFLDYRNSRLFEDDYSIIYGHNMRADLMLSDIKRFENTAFFNTHRVGTLWTGTGMYRLEFLYYAKFNAFNNRVYNLITYKDGRNEELAGVVKEFALNSRGGEFDKLLLLSTCNTAGSNDRAVLLARMILVGGDTVVGNEGDLARMEREKQILEGDDEAVQREAHIESQSWLNGLQAWFGGWTLRDVLLFGLTIVVIIIFMVLAVMEMKRWLRRKKKSQKDGKISKKEKK